MPSLRGKITWRYSQKASTCNPRKEASGKTTLLTLRSLTSNLQSREELNFCCLSHSVCGISWWPLDRLISYVTANIFRFLSLSVCLSLSHYIYMCVCVKWSEVAQSCPTLCDPVDCSPPGSSTHGILQARILEWVAISFFRESSQPRDWTQVSCIAGRCFNLGGWWQILCFVFIQDNGCLVI